MLLQVLITVGASQALALAILILLKKQPSQADYLLSLKLFLVFVITLLYNYHDELEPVAPFIALYSFVLGYLVLPVFYFYIQSASGKELDFTKPKNYQVTSISSSKCCTSFQKPITTNAASLRSRDGY